LLKTPDKFGSLSRALYVPRKEDDTANSKVLDPSQDGGIRDMPVKTEDKELCNLSEPFHIIFQNLITSPQ
jgi:hypothetical protein